MKKNIIVVSLFLVFFMTIDCFASGKQKVIGPVIAIKRSYVIDLDKCKNNFRATNQTYDNYEVGCQVEVFKSNGSEMIYHQNENKLNVVVDDIKVQFYGDKTGYGINAHALDHRELPVVVLWSAIVNAYKKIDMESRDLDVVVHLAK